MASINFINECKNYAYMNRYGKLEFGNLELELNQSNKIQDFTIDSGCYIDGNIVGSVYVKQIEANLIDAIEDNIENEEFDASVGVAYHQPYSEPFEIEGSTTQYTTTGKSLLNPSRIEQAASHGGITCTYDADTQIITFNGTCDTNNTTFYFTNSGDDISNITANLTTMSAYYVSGSIANYLTWRINNSNWSTSKGQDLVNIATDKIISFSSTTSWKLAQSSFSFRFNNGSVANNLKIKIMVANSTNTTYEPFTNQIPSPSPNYQQPIITKTGTITETINNEQYTFHLGSLELCKIGDYKDFIFKNETTSPYYDDTLDLDAWYVKKNVGKVVLNGTETINVTNTSTANWYYVIVKSIENFVAGQGISSHYSYAAISNSNTVQGFSMVGSPKSIRIRYGTEDTPTNFKQWLSNNNVEIYFVLATPTYTKIIDETLLYDLNFVAEPYEYMDLGSYIVEKPTDEQFENLSSFVGYDTLINHINDIYATNLDYANNTITIGDIYVELCASMELTPTNTTFINSTIEVESNPFTNNEKNRDVLTSIAKVSCSFVDIDYESGEIDLKWLSNSLDYTFQKDDYSSLEGGKTIYGPVNSLIIRSSFSESENVSYQDDESIVANGEHQLVIIEDYFLYNSGKRQAALTGIWNRVNGLTYTQYELTTYTGKPFLKSGNKIRIYTDDNEYIDSYILENQFTFDGAFKSVLKAPALTDQEVKTKQDVSLKEKLRNTEITVNKQEGIINELVQQTDENTSNITNLLLDVNGIQTNVASYEQVTNEQLSALSDDLDNYKDVTDDELDKINDKFGGLITTEEASGIYNSIDFIQTNTYTKTEVNTMMVDGTVKKLSTTSMTVDENGMTFEKTNAKAKTNLNQDGITVLDNNDDVILKAAYDSNIGNTVVDTYRHQVHEYFIMGQHSRFEDFENGTGCFYI